MSEQFPRPTGYVVLRVTRAGVLIAELQGPNLVVDTAGTTLARLAAGEGVIDTFAIGTDGTAPDASDTALTGAFTRPLVGAEVPSPGSVTFEFRVPAEEAPTMTVREIGLLDDEGTLVARKILTTAQPIEPGVEIAGTWTLTWS